jgi:hypothetical protein
VITDANRAIVLRTSRGSTRVPCGIYELGFARGRQLPSLLATHCLDTAGRPSESAIAIADSTICGTLSWARSPPGSASTDLTHLDTFR